MTAAYRAAGVALPPTRPRRPPREAGLAAGAHHRAPVGAGTPWIAPFRRDSSAFASGWMRIRGARRRRAVDRGFVLSDHVDWPGLNRAVELTGARRVWVTHGYTNVVARWLQDQGLDSQALETSYSGEVEEPSTHEKTE